MKQRVLEEMINAELIFQEAVRRYGELPKNAAIKRNGKPRLPAGSGG